MSREELKALVVEYTLNAMVCECASFCKFYKLEGVNFTYQFKDAEGVLSLNDKGEMSELYHITFENAPGFLRQPGDYLMPHFQKLIDKYELEAPQEFQPTFTVIPDEPEENTQKGEDEPLCQETN